MCLLGHVLIVSLPVKSKDGSFLCYRGMFGDMHSTLVVLPDRERLAIIHELHANMLGLREKSIIEAHSCFLSCRLPDWKA